MRGERFEMVRLSGIGADERFRITTRTDDDRLRESVRYAGLISPPILLSTDSDFIIVCGFRRVAVCRSLDITEIPARILPPDTGESECLKLAISDNALQRDLNLIETSLSLHKLSAFSDTEKDLIQAASSLGLPSNPSLIRKLKNLCLLPQPIRDGILSEAIALPVALELRETEPDAAIAIAELLVQLNPSLNKQREILTFLKEITLRENISFRQLLEDIDEIAKDPETDRSQKLGKIRLYLKQRRYPAVSHAENAFERLVGELKPGNGIELIPPKYFEGREYMFAVRFETLAQLRERMTRLEQIAENPLLKQLVK